MPLRVTIDHENKLVTQQGADPIALPGDVFAALDEQAQGGGWAYPTLADFSRVRETPSASDLHAFLDHVAELSQYHGRRGPVAFVVPDNLALYGMFRMYSIVSDTRLATQVFKSFAEAEDWLRSLGHQPGPSSGTAP